MSSQKIKTIKDVVEVNSVFERISYAGQRAKLWS